MSLVCGPNSSKKLDPSVHGSRNGVHESLAVGGGVDTDESEVAREALHDVEVVDPIGDAFAGAIWPFCGDVEALLGGGDAGNGQRQDGREFHIVQESLKKAKRES